MAAQLLRVYCTRHAYVDVADGTSLSFSSPELTQAGRYTVAAVFEETRPDLVQAIGKRDAVIRSAALELHVQPGPPATLLMLHQVHPSPLVATSAAHSKGISLVNHWPNSFLHAGLGALWYDQ